MTFIKDVNKGNHLYGKKTNTCDFRGLVVLIPRTISERGCSGPCLTGCEERVCLLPGPTLMRWPVIRVETHLGRALISPLWLWAVAVSGKS